MGSHTITVDGVTLCLGNSKMGGVMHVNLPPPKSCDTGCGCFTGGCYAVKFRRLRATVAAVQDRNWAALMRDRGLYFDAVARAVACYRPALFRWHSAGDIPDLDYLERMAGLAWPTATSEPRTRYLCFTKKYDLLRLFVEKRGAAGIPPALTLMASAWPGLALPEPAAAGFAVAWMRDAKDPDPRIPASARECGGGCDTCQLCWGMRPGESVVFDKH